MPSAANPSKRLSENISSDGWPMAHWIVLGLFLVALGFSVAKNFTPIELPGKETALVLLTTATTLLSLSRRLPAQNVLLAAVVIASIGGAVHFFGARTGM